MAFQKVFSLKQGDLLKKVIQACLILGKGNPQNQRAFFVRVLTRFNKISSDMPLRFRVKGSYERAFREFKVLLGESISEINSFDLKDEFKTQRIDTLVTFEMIRGARQADARHRKVLGDDY